MKRKIYMSLFAITLVMSVHANSPMNSNAECGDYPSTMDAEEASGYQTKSPISYEVYKPKYSYDYSIDFYNNTRQTLEVKYIYASPNSRDGWIVNYVRVPGGGKNKNNAAGPYGQVEILDVYRP